MRKRLQGLIVGMLLGVTLLAPAQGSTMSAPRPAVHGPNAWTVVEIHVPAYGYFVSHGHCRTEDMVLAKVQYPGARTDKRHRCVHQDTLIHQ